MKLAASSTEYLSVPVSGDPDDDLITLPVEVAVISADTEPAEPNWHFATWDDDGNARILIGPEGVIELDARLTYTVWVRVTAYPERPVIRAGQISTY